MRRKLLLVILVITGLLAGVYVARRNSICPLMPSSILEVQDEDALIAKALQLLKAREDAGALAIFEKVLTSQPDNLYALWGKAEVLRRSRDYGQAHNLLLGVLNKDPGHHPSLISLSYIEYKDDKLSEALKLINRVLRSCPDGESQALAYMMLGSINNRRAQKGWFISKVAYGTHIKGYFIKARELAPDLPEVHLGLGTFYLLAPAIVGGDLDKAIEELESAVKIAPEFATANARLAQAYKKQGDLEKYNFYIQRARELDPENEVLMELDEKCVTRDTEDTKVTR